MTKATPYYRVARKNGRAYWCPTKRMRALGFELKVLGQDSPEARAEAQKWTARWREALKEARGVLGPREPDHPPAGRRYIYFIQIDDRVKIGVSWKPFARARDIAGGAHGILRKAIIIPGTAADERRLHRRFASYRTNGEWFVASRPLLLTMYRCAMAGQVVHDEASDGTKSDQESNRGGFCESNREERGDDLNA